MIQLPKLTVQATQTLFFQLSSQISQTPTDDGQSASNIYNAQELEDCDETLEIDSKFYVLSSADADKGFVVNLSGRQWLFNLPSMEDGAPSRICLRHDVDGLVWQPERRAGKNLII